MNDLNKYQALLLNADYRPVSTYPLSSLTWTEAIKDALKDKVIVVAEYDRVVRSARQSYPVPSVVALKQYVDLSRPAPFNRMNLAVRDRLRCAYCGDRLGNGLTFDHVIPSSQGGKESWENIVAACAPCNFRKANRTPKQAGMPLRVPVYRPTLAQLNAIGTEIETMRRVPKSWLDWLYWTVQLEED